jgi:hypothetical protein
MMTVGVPNTTDTLECVLVANVTTERVAGVGRIRDHPTLTNEICGLTNETRLGVFGVKPESLHRLMIPVSSRRPL